MRVTLIAILMMFSCAVGRGQGGPDPFYWRVENTMLPLPAARLNVLDGSGTSVTTYPLAGGVAGLNLVIAQVAKAADGTVWVTDGLSGTLTPYTIGGGAGASLPAPAVASVAVDVTGGPWTLEGSGLVMRDVCGNPVVTSPHGLASPVLLLNASAGSVWVLTSSPAQFQKVVAGGPSGPVRTALGFILNAAAVDSLGQLWLLTDAGLEVFDGQGNPMTVLSPACSGNLAHVTVDSIGRIRTLVSSSSGGCLITYDPATLGQTGVLTLPSTPQPYVQANFDHFGRCWLESAGGQATLLDRSGQSVTSLGLAGALPPMSFKGPGDPGGAHLLSILIPTIDSDLDSFTNGDEARYGSDALDAASLPAAMGSAGGVFAGQITTFHVSSAQEPGFLYLSAASLGNGPSVISPLEPHSAPLSLDALLAFWIGPANFVLTGPLVGTLSNGGLASFQASFPIGTSGFSFQMAMLTMDPATGALGRVSPAVSVVIQ